LATLAASAASARPSTNLAGRRYDHYFFSAMAALMLVTVFVGFSRSYYLAGLFHAPLPSRILHLHGAAFTLWMLLLITQTSLVAAGRTDIHRRLGIAGFALGCFMVVLGVAAGTDLLLRQYQALDPYGRDPRAFYAIPISEMLLFAFLLFCAFRSRYDPAAHKRLILIANIDLLVAAIARWPVAFTARNNPVDGLVSDVFLLLVIAYDYWSTRKIHRVTLWAGALLVFTQQIRGPVGKTAAWHAFANWVIARLA
jgi:hypothetical protein